MLTAPLQQIAPAMACDGVFVYLLYGGSLLKIGTGFGGSYKGHVYAQNDDFSRERNAWLGYSAGQLYFRRNCKRSADQLQLVGMDTLSVKSMNPLNMLSMREGLNYVLFTDDDSLHAICSNRDVSLTLSFKLSAQHSHIPFFLTGHIGGEETQFVPQQLQQRTTTV